jgi:hypothetical protein
MAMCVGWITSVLFNHGGHGGCTENTEDPVGQIADGDRDVSRDPGM